MRWTTDFDTLNRLWGVDWSPVWQTDRKSQNYDSCSVPLTTCANYSIYVINRNVHWISNATLGLFRSKREKRKCLLGVYIEWQFVLSTFLWPLMCNIFKTIYWASRAFLSSRRFYFYHRKFLAKTSYVWFIESCHCCRLGYFLGYAENRLQAVLHYISDYMLRTIDIEKNRNKKIGKSQII